jgi:pimeloyl-ACP methyl ester carboxylesterase
MQLVVNGLLTNYERLGKGRQVVILPGWADTLASWRWIAAELANSYEVVSLDLPGFGGSEAPAQSWGLDDYAGFVSAFITKLGLKPYALLSHSNGGAITIRGLANGQLKTEKLLLLASAGIRGESSGRLRALKSATKVGKLFAKPLPQSVQAKLRRKLYGRSGSDMLVAEHMQETFKRVVSDDIRESAAQVTQPALLVYGANDEQTPPRHGETLSGLIKGSHLEIIPQAGHFVQLDQPARVLVLCKGFLG